MAKLLSIGPISPRLPAENAPAQPAFHEERSREPMLRPRGGRGPQLFCEHLGIVENPFGVTPNPRYLYQGRSHAEARASLIIGIESGLGFQALIAPPGMGKTTILFDLLERFHRVARTAFLFQIQGDARDFLRYLISELNGQVHDSDLVNIQDAINRLLIKERRAGRRTIIVIDEAQSLSASVLETVRLLSNFETSTEKLVQIVLAGQPQLAKQLATQNLAQLHQRISILRTLVPFDLEDTRNYIEHRLRVAGYQGQRLFTPPALRSIWENSHGVPREINTICFNALLLATAIGKQQVDTDTLHEVIADLEPVEIDGSSRNTPKPFFTRKYAEKASPEDVAAPPAGIERPVDGPPQEYLQFYSLSRNPFDAAPDPGFLCFTSTHSAALAAIYTGILQHQGVLLLTGGPGTGKSLTAACLLDLLKCGHVPAEYLLGRHLSSFDWLKFASEELDSTSPYDTTEDVRTEPNNYLTQERCNQTLKVLLVDEADGLSIDALYEIQLLAKLQNPQQRILQIVLAGHPELDHMLNTDEFSDLRGLIAVRCHLKPLDEGDIQKYIACRLRIALAGSHPGPVFLEDALASVCCHSRGIPRLINRLCEGALVRGHQLRQMNITAAVIEEVANQPPSDITPQERIPHSHIGDANEVLKAARVLLEFRIASQTMHRKSRPPALRVA